MEYSGRLTREQFLYKEIKIVARLKRKGFDESQIVDQIFKENLFQYPTERMVKNITGVCLKRLEVMNDDNLVDFLVQGSTELSKQINLYVIMKREQLVSEFMISIIGEKYSNQDFTLLRKDLNLFFSKLKEQEENVATWSDATINKIKQVLMKILIETGYIAGPKSEILQPVYLYDELESAIREKGDQRMLPAFNKFI
jgi:hypothetical protein